jgi:thioredoxin reductase (NADPH)
VAPATGSETDGSALPARAFPRLEQTFPFLAEIGQLSSVKRVGGAIGEGAQVVAALHGFLGDAAKPAL